LPLPARSVLSPAPALRGSSHYLPYLITAM